MTLCINCNIAINAMYQNYEALNMSPEMVSIIEEWIAQEVTDRDHICQECFDLLLVELNNRNENIIGNRLLGHQSVCVCCGISIARRTGRRSHSLLVGRPERAHIANIIEPRQIPADAQACNACWQRAHRSTLERVKPQDAQYIENILERRSSLVTEPSAPSSDFEFSIVQNEKKYVELNGYSRTPDTSSHCFVPECTNPERLRVPLYLKKQILMDYKLYVTQNARVCEEHAGVYNWELLNSFEFTTQFTIAQIVEMLDLLRQKINYTTGISMP